MKKIILGLLSFILFATAVQAQDAKKALKTAGKALTAFKVDQSKKGKLTEAYDNITIAVDGLEDKDKTKALLKKGEICNEIATQIVTVRQLGIGDLNDLPKVDNPAIEAYKSFETALGLAQKKYEKKDAIKGLSAAQSNLYNLGIFNYEDKNFDGSYENFNAVLAVHQLLKDNGGTSTLASDEQYNEQVYLTGLAALNAKRTKDAASLFQKLYDSGYAKPAVYEAMYKISADDDAEAAYKYLEAGRTKFPDDVSLLFAEINHFLKLNKLDELIGKLKVALEKEPDNVSLYSTLGNVYDNLYTKAAEAGETEKAEEYFNNALDYYNQSLTKKPDYFDAIYSIGALYYNKAAAMTNELNTLSNDFSKEGLKKYEALKAEVFSQFDQALPYFKKAEKLNPNDINTLIALKEIFAKKDDLATSGEFKKRLETVQSGGTNATSYFNE